MAPWPSVRQRAPRTSEGGRVLIATDIAARIDVPGVRAVVHDPVDLKHPSTARVGQRAGASGAVACAFDQVREAGHDAGC